MIVVRLSGGMGNQMFQYALGRKMSLQYNVPLKLDTTFLLHRIRFLSFLRPHFVFRNYDLDVFTISATIADKKDMKWWQRPILSGQAMLFIDAVLRKTHLLRGWERSYTYDPYVLGLGPNVYLAGFWQSPKYFSDIRETLLSDFSLIEPLSGQSLLLQEEIQGCNAVCLHIRRSDIEKKDLHGSLDQSYYDRSLEYINAKSPIEKIFVFSDDIAWCKDNLTFRFETVFVGEAYAGKKGEGHMALMKSCKHFIISNSTFAWWGAWLATHPEKIVIAPKEWFANGWLDSKDLIPEEWVRI